MLIIKIEECPTAGRLKAGMRWGGALRTPNEGLDSADTEHESGNRNTDCQHGQQFIQLTGLANQCGNNSTYPTNDRSQSGSDGFQQTHNSHTFLSKDFILTPEKAGENILDKINKDDSQ